MRKLLGRELRTKPIEPGVGSHSTPLESLHGGSQREAGATVSFCEREVASLSFTNESPPTVAMAVVGHRRRLPCCRCSCPARQRVSRGSGLTGPQRGGRCGRRERARPRLRTAPTVFVAVASGKLVSGARPVSLRMHARSGLGFPRGKVCAFELDQPRQDVCERVTGARDGQ